MSARPDPRPTLLVLLQNAYDRGTLAAGYAPGRWRREFLASRTGRRLARVTGGLPLWRVAYANACPGVHPGADSRPPACRRHVRRALRRVRPAAVLACGKVAEAAAAGTWPGPLLAIPHPACRVLTNALLDDCGARLRGLAYDLRAADFPRTPPRLALRQRRGTFVIEELSP